MDLLGTVLASLTLVDGVLGPFELGRPWAFDVPPVSRDHFFVYAVREGRCGLAVHGHEPLWLEPGDIALVLGASHAFYSDADRPRLGFPEFWAARGLPLLGAAVERQAPVRLSWQAGAAEVDRLVSLGLIVRDAPRHPVLAVLPRLMVLREGDGGMLPWLHDVLRFADRAEGTVGSGYDVIARQLAYLVFLSLVRAHAIGAGSDRASWLRGLADRNVGAALVAMHGQPAEDWTVARLARTSGMSRSSFSQRFAVLVGETPMAYLTAVRMQAAAALLVAGTPVGVAAAQVGYRSEWAFRRAFAERFGCTPLRYGKGQRAKD
jgi:AraC-like DNA-binding protein